MRIGGEAPRRRTHSRNRFQNHGLLRVTATSDRHRTLTMFCSSASESWSFLSLLSLTPLAIRRQPEPRPWLPDATRQLAICAPELQLLFCGFCHPQFESDTTGPMHCPSERAKSAKPTESFRGVLVRCPPWRALSCVRLPNFRVRGSDAWRLPLEGLEAGAS